MSEIGELTSCPTCGSTVAGCCTLVTGIEHLHNGPESECCKNPWHMLRLKWFDDNPCSCTSRYDSPSCLRHGESSRVSR